MYPHLPPLLLSAISPTLINNIDGVILWTSTDYAFIFVKICKDLKDIERRNTLPKMSHNSLKYKRVYGYCSLDIN